MTDVPTADLFPLSDPAPVCCFQTADFLREAESFVAIS